MIIILPPTHTYTHAVDIHPPVNVKADPSLSEDGRTMDVDISWQILRRPYSSMTFYVTVKQHPKGFIATPVLEVVGKVHTIDGMHV